MAAITIQEIVKSKFYECHAKGVTLQVREDQVANFKLSELQAARIETVLDSFFAELSELSPIHHITFVINAASFVDVNKYSHAGQLSIQVPCMPEVRANVMTSTFEKYISDIEVACKAAVKIAKIILNSNVSSINFNIGRTGMLHPETILAHLETFETQTLQTYLTEFKDLPLRLRIDMSSQTRFSFTYTYQQYDKSGLIDLNISFGDIYQPISKDALPVILEKRMTNLFHLMNLLIEPLNLSTFIQLNYNNQFFLQNEKLSLEIIEGAIKLYVDEFYQEKLEMGQQIRFDVTDRINFVLQKTHSNNYFISIPLFNPHIVFNRTQAELKALPKETLELYKDLEKLLDTTGLTRFNIDPLMTEKFLGDDYRKAIIKNVKTLVKKLNPGEVQAASITLMDKGSYNPTSQSKTQISIPTPDCTLEEMDNWFKTFITELPF